MLLLGIIPEFMSLSRSMSFILSFSPVRSNLNMMVSFILSALFCLSASSILIGSSFGVPIVSLCGYLDGSERLGDKPSQDKMLCCSKSGNSDLEFWTLNWRQKVILNYLFNLSSFSLLCSNSTVVVFCTVKFRSLRSMIQLLESNPIWNIAAECCSLLSSSNTTQNAAKNCNQRNFISPFYAQISGFYR